MPDTFDAVVRSWFEELWNNGNEETIDRLYAVDGIAHGLPSLDGSLIQGWEAFRFFFRSFRSAFPDIRVDVTQTVTNGDMTTALCHVTGTHQGHDIGITATGKNVD